MKTNVSLPFMLLGILFTVCLIAANILETKILQVGFITATAGMLIFPISYIVNDCIAEIWGYKKARLIIWIAFAMNFFVVGVAQLAVIMPAASYWDGADHFNFVFGMTPRIVFASLCAFLAGSFMNAYIMSRMKLRSKGKGFSIRAIVSTIAGESLDSLIFFPIAFGGIIAIPDLLVLMGLQALMKTGYEVMVLPLTVQVVKRIKKMEGTDVFDENISFNPFKIKDI